MAEFLFRWRILYAVRDGRPITIAEWWKARPRLRHD